MGFGATAPGFAAASGLDLDTALPYQTTFHGEETWYRLCGGYKWYRRKCSLCSKYPGLHGRHAGIEVGILGACDAAHLEATGDGGILTLQRHVCYDCYCDYDCDYDDY